MEPGIIIIIAVCTVILGFVIGTIFGHSRSNRKFKQDTQYTQGTLNVDNSDPEFGAGLFLALGVPVTEVMSRKYVSLDVNIIDENSHE